MSYKDIEEKNYSLSAGQYFEVKIEYVDITHEEFEAKLNGFSDNLGNLFSQSRELEAEIQANLTTLKFDHAGQRRDE